MSSTIESHHEKLDTHIFDVPSLVKFFFWTASPSSSSGNDRRDRSATKSGVQWKSYVFLAPMAAFLIQLVLFHRFLLFSALLNRRFAGGIRYHSIWAAFGDLCQALWDRLLTYTGDDPFTLYVYGILIVSCSAASSPLFLP